MRPPHVTVVTLLVTLIATSGLGHPSPAAGWTARDTGTDARLRGLAPVSHTAAWVAGSGGTVLRTTDAGRSWHAVAPPGTAELEFRDIEAFDARHAVALSIGEGE